MIKISVSAVSDFDELGARWRALEARAEPSFFQSWTWTGCLARERFPDALLVEARDGTETIGLALFNRRRRFGRDVAYLGESGIPSYDRLFIEHNGPLVEAGRPAELSTAMLGAVERDCDVVLSGLGDSAMEAARGAGASHLVRTLPALVIDLAGLRQSGGDYLDRRSANTRQQIRRSDRAYSATGPLAIARATTVAEASAWLDEMSVLHQATWIARGEPGCFAEPFFRRFHGELIRRGMPEHEIDLLRVTAGPRLIGILYNFRHRGRALAYQSGFDYGDDQRNRKPGLTCHHQAIRYYAAEGADSYDFLAGEDRYKRSLADKDVTLHWIIGGPPWSPRMLALRTRRWVTTKVRNRINPGAAVARPLSPDGA